MESYLDLSCPQCRWTSSCSPASMLDWLRRSKMTRRGAEPEPELIAELFRAGAARFECPECHATGLVVTTPEAEDDEDWQMARACDTCGKPIARERLEVFPNARTCVTCQARDDRGEATGPAEYCPRCGNVLVVRQSRGAGVTRYVSSCPSCRR